MIDFVRVQRRLEEEGLLTARAKQNEQVQEDRQAIIREEEDRRREVAAETSRTNRSRSVPAILTCWPCLNGHVSAQCSVGSEVIVCFFGLNSLSLSLFRSLTHPLLPIRVWC